jgi:hypothetical protein
VLPRALPEFPAELAQPVPHPEIREGDSARVALGRYAGALSVANARIEAAPKWYAEVRAEYGKPCRPGAARC